MDFIGDENKRKFEETVDVIAGIKAIVAGNLKVILDKQNDF